MTIEESIEETMVSSQLSKTRTARVNTSDHWTTTTTIKAQRIERKPTSMSNDRLTVE